MNFIPLINYKIKEQAYLLDLFVSESRLGDDNVFASAANWYTISKQSRHNCTILRQLPISTGDIVSVLLLKMVSHELLKTRRSLYFQKWKWNTWRSGSSSIFILVCIWNIYSGHRDTHTTKQFNCWYCIEQSLRISCVNLAGLIFFGIEFKHKFLSLL